MLGDKPYTQSERSWKVVDLAWLPNEKGVIERFVISAETISGMLYIIVFEGHFDPEMIAYRGNIYEYVDRNDRPVLHTIAKDIGFDGALSLGSNDEGKRFAGILDGSIDSSFRKTSCGGWFITSAPSCRRLKVVYCFSSGQILMKML